MRGKEQVLEIGFDDRLGLGYEIFSLLKQKNINLVGMEAKANEKMTIKFNCASQENIEDFILQLKNIPGIATVSFVELMPYEQRERQLETILDSVSEGIIAVNEHGMITHINQKAKKIFYVLEKENVIGMKAQHLLHRQIPIIETLQTGSSYHLKEIKMKKGNKTLHYLTSGVPILNKTGKVMGAVATIKDYKEIEEIISKVDSGDPSSFEKIVYQSPQMRHVIETAKMVSKSSSSILLRGESGTGKELFARAIHLESNRAKEPFVVINIAAIPESLLESELFGYEEGSFTGASRGGKKGLFEQANKGTLFLDEIGELSSHMQVRLLRVLQEGTIRRIGGSKEISVDVRIIAATHRNLETMVKETTFREDLYYRLNVVPIHIPPLRSRKEDIPLIARSLAGKISKKLGKQEFTIDEQCMEYLMDCSWPGNVRQLENTLERIMNVIPGPVITVMDFKKWMHLDASSFAPSSKKDEGGLSIHLDLKEAIPQLKDIVDEVERKVISEVLKIHDSSRKAGRVLGISNTTVINKMRKHGIYSSQVH